MVTLDQAGWNRASIVMVAPPTAVCELIDFLWIDERPRFLSGVPVRRGDAG